MIRERNRKKTVSTYYFSPFISVNYIVKMLYLAYYVKYKIGTKIFK